MRRRVLCMVAVVFGLLTLAPPAVTQPSTPSAERVDKGDRRKARKRLGRLRERILKRKVGLSEDKTKQVLAILEGQQAQRHAYEKQIRASRKAMRQLFQADSSDQAAFAKQLDTLQASHRGMDELRDEQLSALRKILTPKEQAKLLRAMEMVKRRLEKRRRRR